MKGFQSPAHLSKLWKTVYHATDKNTHQMLFSNAENVLLE